MGDSKIDLTGGTDSMSQAPFVVRNIRFGTKLGANYNVRLKLYSPWKLSYHISAAMKNSDYSWVAVGRLSVELID